MRILLIILLSLFLVPAFSQQYFQVVTDVLNVRKSPSVNGEIIFKLQRGDSSYVLDYQSEWSKIVLPSGEYGYVSSKYISKDFKDYSASDSQKKKDGKASIWGSLAVLLVVILSWSLKSGKSDKTKSHSKRNVTPVAKKPQNDSIAYIKEDGHWLRVYNSDGKQLSTRGKGSQERLMGHSDKLIVIEDGHWLRVFDSNFKQVSSKGKTHETDYVKSVSGETITVQEGHWIRTYNKSFKLVSTRS